VSKVNLLLVVARAADVGMEDRHAVRGTPVCGVSIDEDGTDRAVSQRADLDSAGGGSFQPCDAE
jgi:hypothetical protein